MKDTPLLRGLFLRAPRPMHAWALMAGCLIWTPLTQQQSAVAQELTSSFEPFLAHLADVSGNAPTDPGTLLYRKGTNPLSAIQTPAGQHLTLAQWTAATGSAHIERVASGTSVGFELSGLVPGGVYTAWNNFYQAPGFTPDQANRIGFGALGQPDGSENSFTADGNGTATLGPIIQPPGPLSVSGASPIYVLGGDVHAYTVSLGYHLDGQTHGGLPGPSSLLAVQSVATFVPEPSSIAVALLAVAAFAVFRRRRPRVA